ncbi:MAG: hypothetical protein IT350_12885 [Deltaproteobacteria bacterium]|nr:hypothetical protein [Deltaproteobacteria bacterium]
MNDDSNDRFRSDPPRRKHHHKNPQNTARSGSNNNAHGGQSNNAQGGPNNNARGGPGSNPRGNPNPPQQRGQDGRQDLRWGRGGQGPQGPNRGGQGGQGRFRRGPNSGQQPFAKFGGREPQKPGPNSGPIQGQPRQRHQQRRPETIRDAEGRIDPFELFCAYHLGITVDGGYRLQNIHDLARRFGVPPAELKQALTEFGMDPQTMINSDFDLTLAQLDMQVAPEGVDRRELAKVWFEEFKNARPNSRDWQQEIANDAKENEKIFGK